MKLVASGLLINLGTVNISQQTAIPEAVAGAHDAGTPWVLDPVAIGQLQVRTRLAHYAMQFKPSVVLGNASEISALTGGASGRGTDATAEVESVIPQAVELAQTHGCVVAMSGPQDFITDGQRAYLCSNGDELLTKVTGGGCSLGAYVAAFVGAHEDAFEAAAAAYAA